MPSVFITHAPDTSEARKTVDLVRAAFESARFSASSKPAAQATMPDLAGADLVVFGLQKTGAADHPEELADLLRALKGVNLAGRVVGFFSLGGEKASVRLRKVLRDTDAAISDEEPALGDARPSRPADIDSWTGKLSAQLQDLRRARS
jgi:flavodoxin